MSKYTAEQVRSSLQRMHGHPLTVAERAELFSMASNYADLLRERESAKTKSDPVAWRYRLDGDMQWRHTSDKRICMGEIEPLYAVAPMLASARVPDELKSAPASPLHPLWGDGYLRGWNACRTAMLAAAPKSEANNL